MGFTGRDITDWLIQRRQFVQSGKVTLSEVEIDYYDMFFDVHSEALEILWVQVMEGSLT